MARELMQARFDPDTVEQTEELADEMDISKSELLRRALREKLQREGYRATAISSEADVPDDTTAKYTIGDPDEIPVDHAVSHYPAVFRIIGGALILVAVFANLLLELGVL